MPTTGTSSGGGDAASSKSGDAGSVMRGGSGSTGEAIAVESTSIAPPRTAVLLHTSTPPTARVEGAQRALLAILRAHGLDAILIDGAEPALRDLRNEIWAVAGQRSYPLLCIRTAAPAAVSAATVGGAAPAAGVRLVPPTQTAAAAVGAPQPSAAATAAQHNRSGSGPTGELVIADGYAYAFAADWDTVERLNEGDVVDGALSALLAGLATAPAGSAGGKAPPAPHAAAPQPAPRVAAPTATTALPAPQAATSAPAPAPPQKPASHGATTTTTSTAAPATVGRLGRDRTAAFGGGNSGGGGKAPRAAAAPAVAAASAGVGPAATTMQKPAPPPAATAAPGRK